ncbi:hypothetical protein [Microbispora bryophytorum]|uniref:hypothetical protein n=1 Tax=Microbispora bryophytorum TaxID=1460882 RepID=UPI0034043019
MDFEIREDRERARASGALRGGQGASLGARCKVSQLPSLYLFSFMARFLLTFGR